MGKRQILRDVESVKDKAEKDTCTRRKGGNQVGGKNKDTKEGNWVETRDRQETDEESLGRGGGREQAALQHKHAILCSQLVAHSFLSHTHCTLSYTNATYNYYLLI